MTALLYLRVGLLAIHPVLFALSFSEKLYGDIPLVNVMVTFVPVFICTFGPVYQ